MATAMPVGIHAGAADAVRAMPGAEGIGARCERRRWRPPTTRACAMITVQLFRCADETRRTGNRRTTCACATCLASKNQSLHNFVDSKAPSLGSDFKRPNENERWVWWRAIHSVQIQSAAAARRRRRLAPAAALPTLHTFLERHTAALTAVRVSLARHSQRQPVLDARQDGIIQSAESCSHPLFCVLRRQR